MIRTTHPLFWPAVLASVLCAIHGLGWEVLIAMFIGSTFTYTRSG